MPIQRSYQKKSPYYVFILWGDKFEEAAVVTFTTTLRDTGLHVKVVGLTGQRSTGKYGMVLCSDLTLGQALALANQAICVIVPCSAATLKRIENDPRVIDFFQRAETNHARFVLNHAEAFEMSSLKMLDIARNDLIFYAERNDLLGCAQEIAHSLGDLTANL